MADETGTRRRYTAIDSEDGREHRLGVVSLDAMGIIGVEEAQAGNDRDTLVRIAGYMNEKPVMFLDAPPDEDDPKTALATRGVKRGNPEFVPALLAYLATYYTIELRAAP